MWYFIVKHKLWFLKKKCLSQRDNKTHIFKSDICMWSQKNILMEPLHSMISTGMTFELYLVETQVLPLSVSLLEFSISIVHKLHIIHLLSPVIKHIEYLIIMVIILKLLPKTTHTVRISLYVVTRCPYESISIYLDTWHWYKLATMHVEFPDQLDGKLNIQHCDIFYLEVRYMHRFFGNFRQICTNESYKCMHKVVINIWIYLYLSIF